MLMRSYVCIAVFLAAGVLRGCSDNHEHGSPHSQPHSDDHVLAQKGEAISEGIIAAKEEETRTKTSSRSADAHTHGDAVLAVVLEKGSVTIELDTPLYNILGFEHAPETQAQKAAALQAELQLTRSSDLFEFNSKANCKNLSQDQKISLFDKAEADEHSGHEGEGHDDEGHVEENHYEDYNDEEDHDAHHQDESHNDVLLTYEFKCEHPLKLSHLNVNLFEFFEELSEVDVTFLGPATQKQVTLTRTRRQLDITP